MHHSNLRICRDLLKPKTAKATDLCRAQMIEGEGIKPINARCRVLAENPIVAQLVCELGGE